ncbi:MAG TPA: lysophospholipid acyltransferase family protein [Hyphomicrobiales bacterium]|nr:lysophospholipid acyltransferase family protein [Hyphomicrobiales bacterium]
MQFLRSLAFNVLAYAGFLILAILFLPTLLFGRGAVFVAARTWSRMTLWLLDRVAGLRLEIRGREHLPAGGCLIASKHQSALETFGVVPDVGDFAFILKRELNWVPVFGWYTSRSGMIGIDRRGGSQTLRRLLDPARRAVREGRRIIIYPEGTRRPVGARPDYKFGANYLYSVLGVPCVPVAVNTGLFWPRRSFRRLPGTAVIEFLEPIPPGLDRRSFATELQNRIETATARLVEEARAAAARPVAVTA